MRPENWITIVGTALTATLTAFGLYYGPKIAVRRSLEQFRSQKWWERKASAYDELIRAASRLLAYHSDCWEQQTRGWRWTEDRQKESDEKHREALAVLETFSDLGGFVISEAAGKVVKRLQASEEPTGGENPVEYHDRASDALIKELVVLKECAVLDLDLTSPRPFSKGNS
jgi:hypothetical protein